MGSPEQGERFFGARWPEARAASDEKKELYAAFGLARGSLGQFAGLRVWMPGLKSILRGHGVGKPIGDPTMMTGWYLVRGDDVLWTQVHEHSGEARRYDELLAAWREARGV